MRTADLVVTFGLNFDTKMLTEALEAHIGSVLFVIVLGMGESGKAVSGSVLGANDAWFARECSSLASGWRFFGVIVVAFALTFNATGGCCGWLTA